MGWPPPQRPMYRPPGDPTASWMQQKPWWNKTVLLSLYNCRISDGASRYIVVYYAHTCIILMKQLTYYVSMEYLLVSSSIGYIRLEAESIFYIQINSIKMYKVYREVGKTLVIPCKISATWGARLDLPQATGRGACHPLGKPWTGARAHRLGLQLCQVHQAMQGSF